MRSALINYAVISMVITLSFTGCKKNSPPADDCATLTSRKNNAENIYNANPGASSCAIFKKALNDYVNSSCPNATEKNEANAKLVVLYFVCP